MLAVEYISLQGATNHIEIKRYLRINAVAMRSVWIAASLCHIFLEICIRRLWTSNRGIPGVFEFLLSIIVLPTVLAHVRFDTVRDARLLEIEEVITNTRRVAIQRVSYFTRFSFIGSLLIGGATIEIKCVFFDALVVTTISILVNGLRLLYPRWQQYKMATVSRTLVPCTAGSLWRPNALVVSWDGAIFIKQSADLRRLSLFSIRDSDGRVSSLSHGPPMRRPSYTTPRAAQLKSTLKTSSQMKNATSRWISKATASMP